MATSAAAKQDAAATSWSPKSVHVQRALKYIKAQGGEVLASDLVAWDFNHGRHLFNWDNTEAAAEWRNQQARSFLNSFRAMFNGYRVRAFINIPKDEAAGISERKYVSVERVADNKDLRDSVVNSLTRRMENIAAELKMWNLTRREQDRLFTRLRETMTPAAPVRG